MTTFTGCILLLAFLLIDVCNNGPMKMVNDNKKFRIREGNSLKLYNRKMHLCKTAHSKIEKENNNSTHKSVMFGSEGEELVIAKKSRRNVDDKTGKSGITYQDRVDLLVAHNHWRRVVDPPASNMIHMVWSLELEKIALFWASYCRYDEGFPDDLPATYTNPDVGIGQSIWPRVGSYNVKAAIEDFYNEKMVDQSTTQTLCNLVDKCRHYKQVVWAKSIYLGCAIVHCPKYMAPSSIDKDVFNLVCNYSPMGNILSKDGKTTAPPFTVGVPGKNCPSTHPQVENGLCRTNPLCDDVKECQPISNTTTCLCDPSYYGADEMSKSMEEDGDSANFMKSSAMGESCCSTRLIVSSISLCCTVFVAFMVTYAFTCESAG